MYLQYYKLREKPFSLTPDPAFLYYSNAHKRAIAFLRYGLQESKGFLQLTGPVGSGKTTLLRAVLEQLDEKTKTAYIINPCASFPELLRALMKDLEIPNIPITSSKIELLDFFHEYLLGQVRRNCPVILIFDEAQNLSLRNLEEIRMLSNFETSKEKLLQIIFVGQPEFLKTLELPELRQLKQRIQVRYHLAPLRAHEVREYINHRLRVAGSNGHIRFTDEACSEIFTFSGGIPRLINAVCDVVLLIGYVSELSAFGRDVVGEAVKELEGRFEDGLEDDEQESDSSVIEREGDNEPCAPPSPPEVTASLAPHAEKATEELQAHLEQTQKMPAVAHDTDGNGKGNSSALSQTVITGFPHKHSGGPLRTQGCAAEVEIPFEQDSPVEKIDPAPLHSFLRHATTRKFRTAGGGLVRLEGAGTVRQKLKQFVSRWSIPRNEASNSCEGAPAADIVAPAAASEGETISHVSEKSDLRGGAAAGRPSHFPDGGVANAQDADPTTMQSPETLVVNKDRLGNLK